MAQYNIPTKVNQSLLTCRISQMTYRSTVGVVLTSQEYLQVPRILSQTEFTDLYMTQHTITTKVNQSLLTCRISQMTCRSTVGVVITSQKYLQVPRITSQTEFTDLYMTQHTIPTKVNQGLLTCRISQMTCKSTVGVVITSQE